MRIWLISLGSLAGLFGASGVALAAVGAHVAGGPVVTTAAYFLLFHAAALAALCAVARDAPKAFVLVSATLIAAGAILFSGDLALRSLAQLTLLRLAAPTGGVLMILGWLGVAWALPAALSQRPTTRN